MTLMESWTSVLSGIGDWFVEAVSSMQELFWNTTDNTLTFLGILSAIGVGIAITLLILNFIRSFIRLS